MELISDPRYFGGGSNGTVGRLFAASCGIHLGPELAGSAAPATLTAPRPSQQDTRRSDVRSHSATWRAAGLSWAALIVFARPSRRNMGSSLARALLDRL